MTLAVYHKKRNFKQTPEPKGRLSVSKSGLLYVIQKHAASHLHYDFRLELNGVLKSWAVPKGPSLDPTIKRLAVHVEDHPLEYGSFEGVIPAGQYGAGEVLLWDTGTWQCQEQDPAKAYAKGMLTFKLQGKKLKGEWKLIRLSHDLKNWLLIKTKDQYARSARTYDILQEKPTSVYGKQVLDKMPNEINPMLATLVSAPPEGKKWLHEIKWDGYRLICFIKKGKIKLVTRNQQDWTYKFSYLIAQLEKLKLVDAILDGELVALNAQQHSDFQLLQNSIHDKDTSQLIYYVFDLLYYNGENLMTQPLSVRKKRLKQCIRFNKTVLLSDDIAGNSKRVFKKACALGLEGIVSKNIDSLYVQKRSTDWLKTKCIQRQEFVVAGFTPSEKRDYFSSLLLGAYNNQSKLEYCGNVGTGFTQKSLKAINDLLRPSITNQCPFTTRPKGLAKVVWVKPSHIAEVEFTEWTKDGVLRHPSFKGLRYDKPPSSVIHEEPMTMNKPITHADKELYPESGITKQDLADYYARIQKWILPYVVKRPLSLVRCPQGIGKPCFYQKHLQEDMPGLYTIAIKEKNADKQPYIYIQKEEGLLTLTQLSVLEIHPWGCHIDNIEKPDLITFDLDPDPEIEWNKVIEAAFFIKEQLEKYKLKSFVKTTGGKGLHVVLPIKPQYTWDKVEVFAHTFVVYLVALDAKSYTGNVRKEKRKGKIFIDYLRNQRGATAIAPYSTRAKPHAPVATPLHWDELTARIKSDSFNIKNIFKRLDKLPQDPWQDFYKLKQKLCAMDL